MKRERVRAPLGLLPGLLTISVLKVAVRGAWPMGFTSGRRLVSGASLVAIALVVPACDEAGPATTPLAPAVWRLKSEPRVTIGQVDGAPEYLFSHIGPGALLPDGRIAVVDGDAAAIRLYMMDGTFDREIGRQGRGPGEFTGIFSIDVVPPDTLVVHDDRLFRLSRFLVTGSLISTLSLHAEDGFPEKYLGEFSDGQLAFAWIRQGPRDAAQITPDIMRFATFGEDGSMIAQLGTETGMLRFGSSPLAFSPHLHAEMIGDSIFLTNGQRPEIQVWDRSGALVRTITVPVPDVDPALAWADLEEVLKARGNRFELGWLQDQPRDVAIPPISVMLVDDQDRIWVKRYDPRTDSHLLMTGRGRGGEWLIMQADGVVVATITLPDGFMLLDVRGGRLLGKIRDDLDVERVQVYEIER